MLARAQPVDSAVHSPRIERRSLVTIRREEDSLFSDQYDAVDTPNRLDASELELRWDDKLEEIEAVRQRLSSLDEQRHTRTCPALSEARLADGVTRAAADAAWPAASRRLAGRRDDGRGPRFSATMLEEGNKDDWFGSPFIVHLAIVAAIALLLFVTLIAPSNVRRIHRSGGPEVITPEDIVATAPGAGEVPVRVKAAGVQPWDAWIRAGKSTLAQPLPLTLGSDISGVVETVGTGLTWFAEDDEVFGVTNPHFTDGQADFAIASAAMLANKSAVALRRSGRHDLPSRRDCRRHHRIQLRQAIKRPGPHSIREGDSYAKHAGSSLAIRTKARRA
jgi:hypothetical protein